MSKGGMGGGNRLDFIMIIRYHAAVCTAIILPLFGDTWIIEYSCGISV